MPCGHARDANRSRPDRGAGAQGGDPRQFLDLLEATDPHELGDGVIKSTRVEGLGATVTFEEMLAAQVLDADEFMEQTTMDFFDYSADDIAIEVPEATVDITDAFAALMQA